ncbi:hypothetical protein LOTGIDRAFT_168730 [Lottia gigantea]|uniref:DNA alkylation repair protein n=1 Tax=Lottia gigantea TaxID=225164 RepID=V4B7E0_LOTGI|nr:hypothetical protein LOTGIDRAFT_168730 [Lottia gigantea]ESO84499.1 hypothetical protein LOTGIDRAFT_168730 [Lottia gigantea]
MPKASKGTKRPTAASEPPVSKRKKTEPTSTSTTRKPEPSMAVVNFIKTVKTKYTAAKNDEYATYISKYMRNQFEFLGLRSPVRRAINTEIFASHKVLSHLEMYDMFYLLWEEPIREYQCFVLDYFDQYIKHINQPKWNDQNFIVLKHLITHKSWWDTVDALAYKGRLVASDKMKYNKLMDEWIEDDNMWLRRTAILHQLMYKDDTDTDRLFRYCLKCAHEKEFFIQKSIGWALRSHFRTDPKIIKDFVKKNEDKLAPLSKKEALKHA